MSAERYQLLGLHLLGRVPKQLSNLVASILYVIVYCAVGYRKAVVHGNLKLIFGDGNAKELTVLSRNFYRHIVTLLMEISRTSRMGELDFRSSVRVTNPELVAQATDNFKRSVLLLSLHQGNWEWLLSGVALALQQPLHVVYKPLHNRAIDKHMRTVRERFGCHAIAVANVRRTLLAARHRSYILAMAADQAPVSSERQYTCEFLSRATQFHAAPGDLAAALKLPVLFARCHRQAPGEYEVTFEVITLAAQETDGAAITARYADLGSAAIRAQPATWLWSHRRWRTPGH